MKRVLSSLSLHLTILLSYAVLSTAMTWPLAKHLDSHLVNAKWYYDALTNIMILGTRVQYLLGTSTLGLYENYFCTPFPDSIVFNENLFGLSLIYLPLYLTTGEYLLSYNLLLLLCLALTGYFTWILVKHLTGSSLAGFVSGVGFAFCPYIFFELGRLQLVAAQWIPLCVFFLHRSCENGRFRDMLALGMCFIMQVGSCLYYAIFLCILFSFVGIWLIWSHKRFNKSFWLRLTIVGLLTGSITVVMLFPYLSTRDDVSLTRTTTKAKKYSGKLSQFLNVYPENKTFPYLHFDTKDGSEQIAFPGFTITLLAILSILFILAKKYKRGPPVEVGRSISLAASLWILTILSGLGAAVIFHTYLAAIPLVILAIIYYRRHTKCTLLPSNISLYLFFFTLSLILFLGIQPIRVDNQSVSGLYYYLYTYVPGFNGIRYVSRQIILIMLCLVILAGFATRELIHLSRHKFFQTFSFICLVSLILLEFLNAPMSLKQVPYERTLPGSYKWLSAHVGPEPIAIIPGHYRGFYGALHNYYTLFHRRKTLNGKSSWIPPITRLYIHEMRRFPRISGERLLRTFNTKYIIVQKNELDAIQTYYILEYLSNSPNKYKQIYSSDKDVLYEILDIDEPKPTLAKTLKDLGKDVVPSHPWQTSTSAGRNSRISYWAIDSNPETRWHTGRVQFQGDWFEYNFKNLVEVVAIDFSDFEYVLDGAYSYSLKVSKTEGKYNLDDWETVIRQPYIQLPKDLVYKPKGLVYRIKLPKPTVARRLRIELIDTIPGHYWSIVESTIWIKKP